MCPNQENECANNQVLSTLERTFQLLEWLQRLVCLFFFVLARLTHLLEMVRSFALRITLCGVCPSCPLRTLGTHHPMRD